MAEPRGVGMGGQVTKDDVRHACEEILGRMAEGFKGVHDRQDKTNGRIQKVEDDVSDLKTDAATLDVRAKNLEREAFHIHRRSSDPKPDPENEEKPIRRRDVWLVLGSVGGTVAVLKFFAYFGPALMQAGKP